MVLPRVMFDHPDVIALDDLSPQDIANRLGVPVALADTLGRRNLLVFTGILMVMEMALLCFVPRGNANILFGVFLLNQRRQLAQLGIEHFVPSAGRQNDVIDERLKGAYLLP